MKIQTVCHMTSVHSPNDTRIVLKECGSLSFIYKVNLVYLGKRIEETDEIRYISAGEKPANRIERMFSGVWKVYKTAHALNADIYHFHDPELLFVGLLLKVQGKKVIYDVHEDVPRQILSKEWIHTYIRKGIAFITESIENAIVRFLDGVVTATPYIADRFCGKNKKVIAVNNYPLLHELQNENVDWQMKKKAVCYIGGITAIRGISEIVQAMEKTKIQLSLAGQFSPINLMDQVEHLIGWEKVEHYGFLNRKDVKKLLSESMAGLVLFHPEPNHVNAQPNKMFEYMSAGIPVIASNFPKWKQIIEGNQCGICVNPMNPDEIAKAIQWIVEHPKEAEQMGKNGRKAIESIYNWDVEKKKLLIFYEAILSTAME